MAAPGDAARCHLVPGRPLAPGKPHGLDQLFDHHLRDPIADRGHT
jgi:hypothetical protein